MSDLDRYLTDEAVEKAAVAIQLVVSIQNEIRLKYMPEYADLLPEYKQQRQHEARKALEVVLPDIIQQAKAEALEAARGPYRCCPHCADDLIHDVEKDDHTAPCQLCQSDVIRRAKAEALREMGDWFKLASDLGTGDRDLIAAQACYDRADRIKQGGQP